MSNSDIQDLIYDKIHQENKEMVTDEIYCVCKVMMMLNGKSPMNVSIFTDAFNLKLRQTQFLDDQIALTTNALFFMGLINLKQRKNSKSWVIREQIMRKLIDFLSK